MPKYNVAGGTLKTARTIAGAHVAKKKSAYNLCIGGKMQGKHFGSREKVQAAFRAAAKECSGKARRKGK